jgi:adenylosuccinate lyase
VIARYTRKRFQEIWSDENRYRKWLDVELAACEAWASLGRIPKKSLDTIRKKARFTVARIEEIEAVTRHDVIAFVSCVAEYVGEDARSSTWGSPHPTSWTRRTPCCSRRAARSSQPTSAPSWRP